MELVIMLLEKELERQNLLIMANKMDKQKRKDMPGIKMDGPPLDHIYPNMVQLRDQIEDAIAYLKTKTNGA
jgi:hypothetical protein